MKTTAQSTRIFSLRQLLASTLVATVDADAATARRYFNTMCQMAFEQFDPLTCRAGNLRTLTFGYTTTDGVEQSLSIPVLSLVPLPLLQVKDADFGFNICVVDMLLPAEEDTFSLDEEEADATAAAYDDAVESLSPWAVPQLRVALQPSAPNMRVSVRLQQADLPGGLSRFLQVVNNMDMKSNIKTTEQKDDKSE